MNSGSSRSESIRFSKLLLVAVVCFCVGVLLLRAYGVLSPASENSGIKGFFTLRFPEARTASVGGDPLPERLDIPVVATIARPDQRIVVTQRT